MKITKKEKLSRLIQLAPLKAQERSAWTMILPYMQDEQVDKLTEVLEQDVRSFDSLVANTK
jgi:hypothetical protein